MNQDIISAFESDALVQGNRWVIWYSPTSTDWIESDSLNAFFEDWIVQIGKIRQLWRDRVMKLLAETYWVDIDRLSDRISGEKLFDQSPIIEQVVRAYSIIMSSSVPTMNSQDYFSTITAKLH